jgi:hypothetical protein
LRGIRGFKATKPVWQKNPNAGAFPALAIRAVREGVCLNFRYHDCRRVVGVFTVGITHADRPAMSAWQIDGQSDSKTIPDWSTFCFDECFDVALSDRPAPATAPDYRKGAKQFKRIDAEI